MNLLEDGVRLNPGYIWCRKCGAPVLVGNHCPICRTDSVPDIPVGREATPANTQAPTEQPPNPLVQDKETNA